MELDPQVSPEDIMSREVELSKLDLFCFELSKLFVNSGATDIVLVTLSSTAVETAVAQCTSRSAMAWGHRLNTSIVLAAVSRSLRSFSDGFRGRDFTLSSPSHSVPVPNKPSRFRGRKATMKKLQKLPGKGDGGCKTSVLANQKIASSWKKCVLGHPIARATNYCSLPDTF